LIDEPEAVAMVDLHEAFGSPGFNEGYATDKREREKE